MKQLGQEGWALVVSCEHASAKFPVELQALLGDWAANLPSHRLFDEGTKAIAEKLTQEAKCPLFLGEYSRLVVDLNRSLGHPALLGEPLRLWSKQKKIDLIERFYRPLRQDVARAVAAALASNKKVLHLSIHSFTPVWNGQERNADFALLYDPQHGGESTFCRHWMAAVKKAKPEWHCRFNYPYRGVSDGHTKALRKQFGGDYWGVELEFNQRLALCQEAPALGKMLWQSLLQVPKSFERV